MPFNEPLPAENTDPWYIPLVVNFIGGLRTFVNALEATVSGKANAADLGTAAEEDSSAFATAAQGAKADSAVQPAEIADLVPDTRQVAGKALSADVTLVKGDVGLGNVDNTSDADKPVSVAAQEALDDKADVADIIVLEVLDFDEAPPAPGVYLRRPAP